MVPSADIARLHDWWKRHTDQHERFSEDLAEASFRMLSSAATRSTFRCRWPSGTASASAGNFLLLDLSIVLSESCPSRILSRPLVNRALGGSRSCARLGRRNVAAIDATSVVLLPILHGRHVGPPFERPHKRGWLRIAQRKGDLMEPQIGVCQVVLGEIAAYAVD